MSKQIKKCAYYDYMLCKTFLHTLVFEEASSPLFLTYCRIDIFRVLRQSFCGKFQIVCGFWNPANPAFRMYGWALLQCYSVVGVLRSVYCAATVLDLIAVFSFVQIQWRESSQSPASSGWKGKLWKWKYILKAANANLLGKTDIKRCVFGKEARK